jgi:hypothetical protein
MRYLCELGLLVLELAGALLEEGVAVLDHALQRRRARLQLRDGLEDTQGAHKEEVSGHK